MSKDKPNILHLFTDMQRFDTIGALGNPVIRTPNLDRLCREGVAFSNAFTPSPVCVAARASMIFGQYPMRTGTYENSRMPTDARSTVMEALQKAGYRTHGIGKCHFTPDAFALRGFDAREIQEEGGASAEALPKSDYLRYLKERGYDHICEAYGVRGEMYYVPQPSQVPAADHPTQWIGDRTVDYVRAATDGEPWYLYSSFIHPHPPLTPPNPWHKLYRPATMPLPNVPDGYESLLTYVNHAQNRYKYRDKGTDPNLARTIVAYYYACISFVDYQVGRILDALEHTGQIDNTLIVFASDHGELLGDYRSYGKRSMHDASVRVPMIARMPGRFDAGTVCDRPVSLVDLAPTFLSVAGASLGTHDPDGVDLHDVVTGASDRRYVYSQLAFSGEGMNRSLQGEGFADNPEWTDAERIAAYSSYMCVSNRWKYIYSAPDNQEYLFDRVRDPRETRNRKGVTFASDALDEHRGALLSWLRDGGETAGLDGDRWRRFPQPKVDSDPDSGLLIQDGYTPWAQMEIPGYTRARDALA